MSSSYQSDEHLLADDFIREIPQQPKLVILNYPRGQIGLVAVPYSSGKSQPRLSVHVPRDLIE